MENEQLQYNKQIYEQAELKAKSLNIMSRLEEEGKYQFEILRKYIYVCKQDGIHHRKKILSGKDGYATYCGRLTCEQLLKIYKPETNDLDFKIVKRRGPYKL